MKDTDRLIAEVKKSLIKINQKNNGWQVFLGGETISAIDLAKRLDKDKKLRSMVLTHYVGLAVELEAEARNKIEGNSSPPQI